MERKTKLSLAIIGGLALLLGTIGLGWYLSQPKATAFTPPPLTPEQVPLEGNFGYVDDPVARAEFKQSLGPNPYLEQRAPQLFQATEGEVDEAEVVILTRSLTKLHPTWKVGIQKIGDCVSWGYKHDLELLFAQQVVEGKSDTFKFVCSESIYGGARVEASGRTFAGYSDGAYGGGAVKWLSAKDGKGGVIFREKYGDLDLTVYDGARAKDWGAWGNGGKGDDGKLDAIARKHPVRGVALVTNFAAAEKAIRSGYPVTVCSGQGFASQRDKDGFCAPRGTWQHCMCFVGVRSGSRPGLLCLNSWGPDWVNGPKVPSDMPDGSFWVDARTATSMLAREDSYALSDVVGFPRRRLRNNEGW